MTDLAQRLRDTDPDRHAMAMLAPAFARDRLVTLYALNLELARTALGARDPMIAEIRVQWWIDRLSALSHAPPPPHELLTPLHAAWGAAGADFAALADARRRDAAQEPFADTDALRDYVRATSGVLMSAAARAVDMPAGAAGAVDAQAFGAGLAAWFGAEAALTPLRLGLADAGGRADLAAEGLAALRDAAQARRAVPRDRGAVLFAGAGAAARLSAVASGNAAQPVSELSRRAARARLALTGRWWAGR